MKKINFKDRPNTETPISASNLNLVQQNVEEELDKLNLKAGLFNLTTSLSTGFATSSETFQSVPNMKQNITIAGENSLCLITVTHPIHVTNRVGYSSLFVDNVKRGNNFGVDSTVGTEVISYQVIIPLPKGIHVIDLRIAQQSGIGTVSVPPYNSMNFTAVEIFGGGG